MAVQRPALLSRRAATGCALAAVAALGVGLPSVAGAATKGSASAPTSARAGSAPGTSAAATSGATASADASSTSASGGSSRVSDVRRVNPVAAAKTLTARGVDVAGTPIEAWSWTDRSGHNLFLTTKQPVLGGIYDGVMRNGILTAYDARGVGSAHMKVTVPLEMNNNEGPGRPLCDVDGGLDFVNYSTVVSDSNHDGVAEVALGWWRMCRGDVGPATANLLVSTGGRAYRISGTGTPIELTKAERDAHIFPPAGRFPLTATPSPRPGAWPRGVYADADALYHATFRS